MTASRAQQAVSKFQTAFKNLSEEIATFEGDKK